MLSVLPLSLPRALFLALLMTAQSLFSAVDSFSMVVVAPTLRTKKASPTTRSFTALYQSAISSAAANRSSFSDFPLNEFSRTIRPDRIRFATSRGNRRRDLTLSISASVEECQALARRFDLKNIHSLEATVKVRAASPGTHSSSSVTAASLEVEGRVLAAVTQTCVRTNEDFPVQVEFPLYAIVRPVVPLSIKLQQHDQSDDKGLFGMEDPSPAATGKGGQRRDGAPSSSSASVSYRRSKSLDDFDLLEIQRLLQEDIAVEDDDANLMEDEAIYPLGGHVDIGELVSQLFWLNLDPYPKKPGTEPFFMTISG